MTRLKKEIIAILSLMLLIGNLQAQISKTQQLDSLMQHAYNIGIFNGNILVMSNNQILYEASFGFADSSKKNKLTPKYRFNIGSITKELSAVSIMKLKEEGKLSLDDKVSKFITTLPKWADSVSVKNLLEYTSGLPDINWNTIKNDADVFNDLKKVRALSFQAGTNFNYNNSNVLLRQFIVEKITNMSFNNYIKKYLLKPSKMKDAEMNPSKDMKNIAKSFDTDFKEDPIEVPISGVVFVTARDLFKWTECLHTEKLISKQSLYEVGQGFKATNSGLGWAIFDNKNLIKHQHDGQSRNFEALMSADLQNKTTVILLGNSKKYKLFEIAEAIKSILKGEVYKMPKKSIAQFLGQKMDSLKIDDFITLYSTLKKTKSDEVDFENEDNLNSMGYGLLNQKRIDDAIKIFQLNIQLFPTSANVYDSMGDAYYNKGDFAAALINFKKSLTLDPKNDNAKQMIEEIEKK